jgi:hypothetical protein
MAAERDFELLDDYLANRLDEKARAAFEQKLAIDPNLKSEFELQQEFVKGIKKVRAAEIKAMLNTVPVPAIPAQGTALTIKVAILTAVVGIVGTGLFLYLKQPDKTIETPETKIEQQPKLEENTPDIPSNEESKLHEVSPVVSEEGSSSEEAPVELPKAVRKNKTKKEESVKDRIKVFDPTKEENHDQSSQEGHHSTLPQAMVSNMVVEIDSENKKYSFHYQFKEGRLFLYGPFEKNLYEILEFFSEDKRTLFLFYKEEYYLLKDDSEKLKPLNPIQDTTLLKKLKESRNK